MSQTKYQLALVHLPQLEKKNNYSQKWGVECGRETEGRIRQHKNINEFLFNFTVVIL